MSDKVIEKLNEMSVSIGRIEEKVNHINEYIREDKEDKKETGKKISKLNKRTIVNSTILGLVSSSGLLTLFIKFVVMG